MSLAAYLAPSDNHGINSPTTLPSKHCRFTASQRDKIYSAWASVACALSSVTMLQTYQGMSLAELFELNSIKTLFWSQNNTNHRN